MPSCTHYPDSSRSIKHVLAAVWTAVRHTPHPHGGHRKHREVTLLHDISSRHIFSRDMTSFSRCEALAALFSLLSFLVYVAAFPVLSGPGLLIY